MYSVIICYRCGQYLLAKDSQKTKQCPYCDARLVLVQTKKVRRAETAQQASHLLRSLKEKRRTKTNE